MIFRITDSVLWLGVAAFTGQISILILSPMTGVVIDLFRRRTILIITQSLFFIQTISLFFLSFFHLTTIWLIVILGVVRGSIAAFDLPARQAFLAELTSHPEEMKQAIAIDGLQINVGRLVGPALGGLLLATWGESVCFLCDAISYLAAVAGLWVIRLRRPTQQATPSTRSHTFHEGWEWLSTERQLRSALLLLGITSLFGMPFTVLLPQYVHDVLRQGPGMLSLLVCASSIGAILATGLLFLAKRFLITEELLRLSGMANGLCLMWLSSAQSIPIAALFILSLSFFAMLQVSATGTFVQTHAPGHMRGRLAGLYGALFWGTVPIGSLLFAGTAHWFGSAQTFFMAGLCCVGTSTLLGWSSRTSAIRPSNRNTAM
jgi:MFS family permease